MMRVMTRRPVILSVAFKRPFSTYTHMGVQMSDNHTSYGIIGDVCHLIVNELKATPLLVSTASAADDIIPLARLADGIIISGGNSNVNPHLYGQKPAHDRQFFDDERDQVERALLEAALRHKIPALMICRGMQLLNVHFGGTLKQEIHASDIDHNCSLTAKDRDASDRHTHEIIVDPASHLSRWMNGKIYQNPRVNSVHEQAIDRLANDFVVEARAPDGTIEAIRHTQTTQFVYGVQWHPDYNPELPASRAVLDAFMDDVRKAKRGAWMNRFLSGR